MKGYMGTEFINEDGSLALSKRVIHLLVNENIRTKDELHKRFYARHYDDLGLINMRHLIRIKGMGRKSLEEIRDYLKSND